MGIPGKSNSNRLIEAEQGDDTSSHIFLEKGRK